ncbi:MAG: hypothetical protein F4112_11555 [Holophagales bacterium]|nr:hypothetical protein [Holophagales bacterium]MYD23415.1 hypothetical protein [Holophagales bacterium]MYI33590.1 hypothetical protein [Holophagales bacterium]
MKRIVIALTLGALPATALAQDLACLTCDHIVPYYRGHGGFIGTVAQDADEVTFVASCGSVTITGEATIQGDTASQLFNRGNGLLCDRDDGTFEIAGLEDGGWFWINDTWSSAVGNLISVDVLDNETVEITDPGDSVSISEGMGAAFLKHTASGRIGILPTILPVPEADLEPVNVCDYTGAGTTASPYRRETSNCALGDGGTVLRVLGPEDVYRAERSPIAPGGQVRRPVASGSSVDVEFDLWGNGTGHFTSAETGDARLGHAGGTPLTATFTGSYTAGGVDADTTVDAPGGASEGAAGLSIATADSVATLTITPNDDYCSEDNDYSVTVTIIADATAPDQVTPTIVELNPPTNDRAATHNITVVCP